MGAMRSICNLIMGPLIIWILILAHIVFQAGYQTPDSIKVENWPTDMKQAEIDAVIESRQPIVQSFKKLADLANSGNSFNEHLTDDVQWENPFFRFEGKDSVSQVIRSRKNSLKSVSFTAMGEYHGPHIMLLEMNVKVEMKGIGTEYEIPIRYYFYLEQGKKGSPEKLFRTVEEWYGNKLLNEKTTVSFLGKLHRMYRQFAGSAYVALSK